MDMNMAPWRWYGHERAWLATLTTSVRLVVHEVDHPTDGLIISSYHPADLQPNEAPTSHLAGLQDDGTGLC